MAHRRPCRLTWLTCLPAPQITSRCLQVATAATVAAAGLEGFRMFFSSLEQADGSFGGGAAAAHAAGTLARMGLPLAVLLPAVAASAAGGGGLGSTALPAPVAWGLAAAVAVSSGGGSLLDQLLFRPKVGGACSRVAGACAVGVLVGSGGPGSSANKALGSRADLSPQADLLLRS